MNGNVASVSCTCNNVLSTCRKHQLIQFNDVQRHSTGSPNAFNKFNCTILNDVESRCLTRFAITFNIRSKSCIIPRKARIRNVSEFIMRGYVNLSLADHTERSNLGLPIHVHPLLYIHISKVSAVV